MRRETFEPRTATYSNQIRRFGSRFGEKEIFSWVDQALDGFFELEAGVLTGSLNVLTVGSHRNDAMNIAQLKRQLLEPGGRPDRAPYPANKELPVRVSEHMPAASHSLEWRLWFVNGIHN